MYLLVDKKCSCNYNPDFLHEARTNNWVFEIIKMDNNMVDLKSNDPFSKWGFHHISETDRVLDVNPYAEKENKLNKLFEI